MLRLKLVYSYPKMHLTPRGLNSKQFKKLNKQTAVSTEKNNTTHLPESINQWFTNGSLMSQRSSPQHAAKEELKQKAKYCISLLRSPWFGCTLIIIIIEGEENKQRNQKKLQAVKMLSSKSLFLSHSLLCFLWKYA